MNLSSPVGPGVIVVAEDTVHDLLASCGVLWNVQERQPSVAQMWDSLSAGRLDQHSRILVFSDSLLEGTPSADAERIQTARAIVAMANAGANVFVAIWNAAALPRFEQLVTSAAQAQGVDPALLVYYLLDTAQGGRAIVDAMRGVLAAEVTFPVDYTGVVNRPLSRIAPTGAQEWLETVEEAPDDVRRIPVEQPGPTMESGAGQPATEPPRIATEQVDPVREFAPLPPTGPAEAVAPPEPPVVRAPAPVGPTPMTTGRPAHPPIRTGPSSAGPASAALDDLPSAASAELLSRPKRPGQVTITVTSSKGGSGKSTASILLAGSINRAARDSGTPLSVCLIDLDTRDGQVASLIGKFMPTALNIRVQPVWDEERIRRNLVHADGLDVDTLLAPIRPRTADTVGPDFYKAIIRSLQRMYDVIVMDTSVQYLDPLIAQVALPEADEILFVTTLASTAVQGMARALREITAPLDESGLGIPREKIGIIVNQSVANVGMERDQVLAAGLGVPVVGVIPLATKDVLTATNLNRMFALLDHPLIGPAYNELARACLPGRGLADWRASDAPIASSAPSSGAMTPEPETVARRGLFRR